MALTDTDTELSRIGRKLSRGVVRYAADNLIGQQWRGFVRVGCIGAWSPTEVEAISVSLAALCSSRLVGASIYLSLETSDFQTKM